ncbi:hypothetical protein [Mumia sp. Pv 4-285]|uniref:hypothetical protein n=1 Tax=Mumia qirimensis TaxID=3234852 RepID=UPI00351CD0EB
MANATGARPQKVTMACLAAGLASAIVLVSVVATLSDWGSTEVRKQIEEALASGPVDGALSIDQALTWLRIALMVAGALSAAAIVLAIWTAKRHRGARIGLTVLAALSSLAFVVAGTAGIVPGLLGVIVVVFLWGAEARAWFAGETATPSRRQPAPSGPPPAAPPPEPPVEASPTAPPILPPDAQGSADVPAPASRPYASAPGPVTAPAPSQPGPPPYQQQPSYGHQPPPYGQPGPYGQQPPAYWQPVALVRPRRLTTAVVIATVLSGLVALVFGANALLYLVSPSEYASLIAEQPMIRDSDVLSQAGMSSGEFARMMFWLSLALGLLAVVGAVSALAMLSRQPATRIVFTVVTGIAMVMSVLTAPLGLVWLAAEIGCVVLVWRRDVSAWFAARR